jgi:protein-arginine kinase activator protein McsA
MIGKNIPVMLAHSTELSSMRVPKAEFPILERLKKNDAIIGCLPKTNKNEVAKYNAKPIILLMAYMHNLLEKEDYENEGIA